MVQAPEYPGYLPKWSDSFEGPAGQLPDEGRWDIIDRHIDVNSELETYKKSPSNIQCSGGNTLQLVPWHDGTSPNGWSSGRIESHYTFTPVAGGKTKAEARIRFGDNPIDNKKGIWPAFWLLGDALRQPGGSWPSCGELDILETINGQLTGYGTVHGDRKKGGIMNEPNGIGATIAIPDQGWHTWRIEWDRTASSWEAETITWFMDGQRFHQVNGGRIGNHDVWATICHAPLFFILNNAVGGDWVCHLPLLVCNLLLSLLPGFRYCIYHFSHPLIRGIAGKPE